MFLTQIRHHNNLNMGAQERKPLLNKIFREPERK